MFSNLQNRRALKVTRIVVLSCCALCAGTSASFAQSSKPVFRAPSLMEVLADGEDAQRPVVKQTAPLKPAYPASQIRSEQPANADNKIVSVSATIPALKQPTIKKSKAVNNAVRQTEYSTAKTKAPYADPQNLADFSLDTEFVDRCPDPKDMPNILDLPYKLVPSPGAFPESCPLPDEDFQRRAPTPVTFTWKASSLCYKPLYFEDVQLERYGHYCHPLLQPALSRVRFWLTIPCLPYLVGVDPPNQCVYDLGYYRPGNCAPSMLEPIPISLRGALLQTGAVVGLAAALP